MDMLEFAVNMELDGKKYYEEQAALHAQGGLKPVFDMLAREEGAHAALLESKRQGKAFQLTEPTRPDMKNVFNGMEEFSSDTKGKPEQVDAYRMALDKERQSIELYTKLLAENGNDGELFRFLIAQEQEHYAIMEELVKLVDRPNSWVESAEFGIREEY